jgi:hypothetical protein
MLGSFDMNRVLSYAVMLVICGSFAIWVATSVGNAVSTSLNATAELIADSH